MTMRTRAMIAAFAVALAAAVAEAKTTVMLFFDTEDYTCDRSNDAIRDIANILKSEGVRGNFNIVGFLALRLQELGRRDAIDALKFHVLGSQTLYHSRHPEIAEIGDAADYETSYRLTMRDEAKAFGMIEGVFGEGRCEFWCPPGNSISPAAIDVYSDLGVQFSAGCGFCKPSASGPYSDFIARPGSAKLGLWYFNQYHLPYSGIFHLEAMLPRRDGKQPDYAKALERLAEYDFAGLYMHPHMAVKTDHWDAVNYRGANHCEWRKWKSAPDRDPCDTAVFYERLKAFIRMLKADPRFEFSDIASLRDSLRFRRPITAANVPAIRAALLGDFNCVKSPASWSVADVFQACVKLLRGESGHMPGKAYGFLSRPVGVSSPVEVSAADLRAAAAKIDLGTFVPSQIGVGGKMIGPADFLFAALEVLETGAEKVTVAPREQLGSFKEAPGLEKMNIAKSWVHSPEFADAHLSERLRLQLWTLRIE